MSRLAFYLVEGYVVTYAEGSGNGISLSLSVATGAGPCLHLP